MVEPVDTGRAMGGVIDMKKKKKIKETDSVLFWHTGGAPALFAYGNDLDLAKKSRKPEV